MFNVTKARREKLKAVIGFIGPSGSGKTAGALLVAYGVMKEKYPKLAEEEVWSKIGVADTEHKRSLLYANSNFGDARIGEFLHIDFTPPYTTDRYNAAVLALKDAGAEVIIVDSLSHNWGGEGGILEKHSGMTGNSFQNWGKLSKDTSSLINTLTRNDVHIFCTLRTKQEYVVEQSATGKSVPRKLGTKPIQKDDFEYEFMINFSISIDHKTVTSKDNSRLFEGSEFTLGKDVGVKLYRWLEEGVDVQAEEAQQKAERLVYINTLREQYTEIDELIKEMQTKVNNTPLEKFPKKLFDRAYFLVNQKAESMTTTTK